MALSQATSNQEAGKPPWTYFDQSSWASISGSQCGQSTGQSPMELATAASPNFFHQPALSLTKSEQSTALGQLIWSYKWPMVQASLSSTPRGWQAQLQSPYDSSTQLQFLDGKPYSLKRIEFTSPSENQLDGESFDMEMQYVMQEAGGHLLINSVFLKVGMAGDNEYLNSFWSGFPQVGQNPQQVSISNPFYAGLPGDRSLFAFNGSGTVPPCRSGVIWVVFKEPLVISREQRDAYRKALNSSSPPGSFLRFSPAPKGVVQPWNADLGQNNRLLQPQASRKVAYYPMLNPPAPPAGASSGDSSDLWGYAGMALLGIAVLSGVLALICFIYSNSASRRGQAHTYDNDSEEENPKQPLNRYHQPPQQQTQQQTQMGSRQGQPGWQGMGVVTQQQMQGMALPPTQTLNFGGPRPPMTQFQMNR